MLGLATASASPNLRRTGFRVEQATGNAFRFGKETDDFCHGRRRRRFICSVGWTPSSFADVGGGGPHRANTLRAPNSKNLPDKLCDRRGLLKSTGQQNQSHGVLHAVRSMIDRQSRDGEILHRMRPWAGSSVRQAK